MDRLVYLAANGNNHLMSAQMANINNLANVNTPGFRADIPSFHSVDVKGGGLPTRTYSALDTPRSDFTPGTIVNTGRDLDVAIEGEGWFAVQSASGVEGYTRGGNFKISPEGMLMTQDDRFVLGNGGPIAIPPAESIEIGSDGAISIRPLGQSAEALAQVDRIKLVNPDKTELYKGEDGLFYTENKEPLSPDSKVTIISGAFEKSNVDAVGALVSMIDFARQYEIDVKLMKMAEDNSDRTARIMQIQ